MTRLKILLLIAVCNVICLASARSGGKISSRLFSSRDQPAVILQFGDQFSATVQNRIAFLVNQTAPYPVQIVGANTNVYPSPSSIVISCGTTTTSKLLLDYTALSAAGPEAFSIAASSALDGFGGVSAYAADGNAPFVWPVKFASNPPLGAYYGCYALLEELGYAFLHPFQPVIPDTLPASTTNWTRTEKPYWPVRGWHYHSEHPLELTPLLQGWGLNGPEDQAGFDAVLPEFELLCEWLVANRQNRLEWVLLSATYWADFATSSLRQTRLATVNQLAYQYGILTGADVPIAERQQHGWYMVDTSGTIEQQYQRIAARIDWLIEGAQFGFIATESGYTEFNHPNCDIMLAWMNYTAIYAAEKYGTWSSIKAHISSGQVCESFKNPLGEGPINFNFLPYYADSRLGVYPHTVQFYTFDDPAPTYGQKNFSQMFDYLFLEAGRREVCYFGETAYWITYDDTVPLFLPLYARARLYDMRKIARREIELDKRMSGAFNFDSGWEYTYWLNDVITARAAWDPLDLTLDDDVAFKMYLKKITRVFGNLADPLADLLVQYSQMEHQLLVLGQLDNTTVPNSFDLKTGIAYLSGWDTWSQISGIFGLAQTQPPKIDLWQMWPYPPQLYFKHVKPLLVLMDQTFSYFTAQFSALATGVTGKYPTIFMNEIVDSATMTMLRARVVRNVYEARDFSLSASQRAAALSQAIQAVKQAVATAENRSANYRVDAKRLNYWGHNNPTAYVYGLLWASNSQYYSWRDIYRAAATEQTFVLNPCVLNTQNIADIGLGEGLVFNLTETLRQLLDSMGFANNLADCIAAPHDEPQFTWPPSSKPKLINQLP
jgi:hypothetical protein